MPLFWTKSGRLKLGSGVRIRWTKNAFNAMMNRQIQYVLVRIQLTAYLNQKIIAMNFLPWRSRESTTGCGNGRRPLLMSFAAYCLFSAYSAGARNAQVRVTPHPQHNSFMSIAAVTPQQIVIILRKSSFILYTGLRRLCASPNLFLGGGLPAIWWFGVELAVQLPGLLQKLYHPQHVSDAL